MKRGVFQAIVLAFAFLFLPQYMNAEESVENDEPQPNLLGNIINQQTDLLEETITDTTEVVIEVIEEVSSGTINSTDEILETVDTTVEQTEVFLTETVNNLDQPVVIVEQTTSMAGIVMESTKALVTHTTESTTETIEKSSDKVTQSVTKTVVNIKDTVENTTDEVVKKAPPIPVVAPVINEVKKHSKVLENVDKTINPIERKIVKKDESIENKPIPKNEHILVPTKKVELKLDHTIISDVSVPSNETTKSKVEIQKLKTITEWIPVVDISSNPKNGKNNKFGMQSHKSRKSTQDNNDNIYQMFNEPLKMTFSSSHLVSSSSNSTPIGGVSDGVMGVLLLDTNQIGLNKVWWNQGNKFALKQWIYDPLGQPPKFTPFLN